MVFLLGLFQSCVDWRKDDSPHHRKRRFPGAITTSSDAEKGKGDRVDSTETRDHLQDDDEHEQERTDDHGIRAVFRRVFMSRGQVHNFAKYCPLLAAILAPFATLMDVPALTVRTLLLCPQAR